MAKADETETLDFGTFVADEQPGKYDREVRALIERDEQLSDDEKAKGKHTTLTLHFPNTPEEKERKNRKTGEKETVKIDPSARYKRYFQDSAKAHGRTAKELKSEDDGKGTIHVTFYLTDQVTRPRKPKDAPEPDAGDAPADEAAVA